MTDRDTATVDELSRARLEYLRIGTQPLARGPRRVQPAAEESWLVDEHLLDDLTPVEPGTFGEEEVPPAPVGTGTVAARRALAFGRAHLRAVLVLLLALGLLAAVFLVRARGSSVPLSAVPIEAASGASGPSAVNSASPTASTGAGRAAPSPVAATLRVHVTGEVKRPGVVSLPAGGRVVDAIEAAGGLASGAAIGELNLAALLSDGDQVVIGTRRRPRGEVRSGAMPGAPASGSGSQTGALPAGGGATSPATVDLNQATAEQLDQLPGVGPVTAQRILEWRSRNGRFTRVEELQEVDGIGPKTYAQLSSHVRV